MSIENNQGLQSRISVSEISGDQLIDVKDGQFGYISKVVLQVATVQSPGAQDR